MKLRRVAYILLLAVIAAQLAKGLNVPKAVSAGFKFVEEMVKDGKYFV